MRSSLWLRWSWRDLRQRWLLVLAISLTIALGTGAFAGFSGTSEWRRQSNDASFGLLAMHDVRVTLTEGTTVDGGVLDALVRDAVAAGALAAVTERLVVPTPVDASTSDSTILVSGLLVGTPLDTEVDKVHVYAGRSVEPIEAGTPVAVLERTFALHHALPTTGSVRIAGGTDVEYVGHGTSPEHFSVAGQSGTGILAEAGFAVLFAPLSTAQQLSGRPRQVNDVVLRLAEGSSRDDRDTVAGALESALAAATPPMSGTTTVRDEETIYRALYEDIDGDAKFWNLVAGLLLAGAAFAAFNLTSRVVEAQRREIGVGMALGLTRRQTAVRPMLLGVQVALLGVVLGLGVGAVVGDAMASLFRSMLPLPIWLTPFQYEVYLRAAALGFFLPLVAVAWPVWRAVRVQPVEAIRVGHLAGRGRGPSRWIGHVTLRGRTWRQMPLRNLLRTPRRTSLTALGVAAAITTLVGIFGLLDSFTGTMDRGAAEIEQGGSGRTTVQLAGFLPSDDPVLAAVADLPQIGTASPGLVVGVTARGADGDIPLFIEFRDLAAAAWRPTVTGGSLADYPGGVLLAEKALRDLGVSPGDSITVLHPTRVEPDGFRLTQSTLVVAGSHPNPLRAMTFIDRSQADLLGLAGLTNVVEVTPAPGVDQDELARTLFAVPGVASVQSASATVDSFRDVVEEFTGILGIAAVVTLLLALLIAFNTTSISVDERARENATMFAFGLPSRSAVSLSMVEAAITGLLGTVLGLGLGYLVTRWMIGVQLPQTLPEIGLVSALSWSTVVVALLVGVGAVALTPLLTSRRLRRMDIPATLRVME